MKNKRTIGSRLVFREYLPLAGSVVTWAIIAAACSKSCAAILLAAWILAGAARALFTVNVQRSITLAFLAGSEIDGGAWRRLWALEGAAATLAVSSTIALALFAQHTPLSIVSTPLLIIGVGLPTRYIGPLAALVRARGGNVAIAASTRQLSGALLACLVALGGGEITAYAIVLTARQWIGAGTLLLMYLRAPARNDLPSRPDTDSSDTDSPDTDSPDTDSFDVLDWGTIAAATGRRGHKRFNYRILKMLLSSLLGPVGTLLARTARGTRLLRRAVIKPQAAAWVLAAMTVGGLVGAAFASTMDEPIHGLLVMSVNIRLVAISTSALFWLRFIEAGAGDDDDDDALED